MASEPKNAIKPVASANAPAPGGHYSQGILANGLIYVSGQLPVAADGSHNVEASFETQVRIALDNMIAVIKAAGGSCDTLVCVTAYIAGVDNWPTFNRIYAEVLGDSRPARTVVPVPTLHYGYLVEVDAVALVRSDE
ncbi:RidA family protein [Mesorhizobium sp.]|uniref:RidA family protein n=1 Tax=Mesorhizobium sp. TaxID=1871066 RepID=UPI0025D85E80|nr:RidA family protein [Mesorhizobium sp.]